jgi:hypothetical protein
LYKHLAKQDKKGRFSAQMSGCWPERPNFSAKNINYRDKTVTIRNRNVEINERGSKKHPTLPDGRLREGDGGRSQATFNNRCFGKQK